MAAVSDQARGTHNASQSHSHMFYFFCMKPLNWASNKCYLALLGVTDWIELPLDGRVDMLPGGECEPPFIFCLGLWATLSLPLLKAPWAANLGVDGRTWTEPLSTVSNSSRTAPASPTWNLIGLMVLSKKGTDKILTGMVNVNDWQRQVFSRSCARLYFMQETRGCSLLKS